MTCHICGAALRDIAAYPSLTRVTSDCRTWPAGGRLAICPACATVQKVLDPAWQADIARIYDSYRAYHQGGGAEQAVFADGTGRPVFRSDRLVERLAPEMSPGTAAGTSSPAAGRLLDIGCGNGPFLRAVSRAWPAWRLSGIEWSDATRVEVEAIAGVEAFYSGPIGSVAGPFDLVSMVHALEHIPRPLDMLAEVRRLLAPGGLLFVEIPNAAANPFDMLIADHASHLSPETLRALIERAGFEVVVLSTTWVTKELSLLSRVARAPVPVPATMSEDRVLRGLDWLMSVRDAARQAARDAPGSFGLFGSSIAATWLAAEVGEAVRFFVDEDPSRPGQMFMGRTVVTPGDTPAGATVFVGLGGGLAPLVTSRLAASVPAVRWLPAPPLEDRSAA